MSQPLPRYLPTDHTEWERKLAAILLETGEPAPPATLTRNLIGYRSSEGDLQRLRAIPCIAKGVGGTVPGTNPVSALLAQERKRLRNSR